MSRTDNLRADSWLVNPRSTTAHLYLRGADRGALSVCGGARRNLADGFPMSKMAPDAITGCATCRLHPHAPAARVQSDSGRARWGVRASGWQP